MKGAESPLSIRIENDVVVIQIGINYIDGHDSHNSIPTLKFDNRKEWVKDVIAEIVREEEDGSTPFSMMLDAAMESALEQGSVGVAEDSFTFIGCCPVCEKDQEPLRHTRNGVRCGDCL